MSDADLLVRLDRLIARAVEDPGYRVELDVLRDVRRALAIALEHAPMSNVSQNTTTRRAQT